MVGLLTSVQPWASTVVNPCGAALHTDTKQCEMLLIALLVGESMEKSPQFLAAEALLTGSADVILDEITDLLASGALNGALHSRAPHPQRRLSKHRIRRILGRGLLRKYGLRNQSASALSAEGVAVYGWFTAESGYGQAARGLVDALREAGTPVSAHNLIVHTFENAVPYDVAPNLMSEHRTLVFILPPHWFLRRLHDIPLAAMVGRRRIGYWPWELPVFPAAWARAFDFVDEVWAPSTFTASAINAATDLPIYVVPHPVRLPKIDKRTGRASCGLPQDSLIFLTAFDSNSFPARKNPLGTITAFRDAFPTASPDRPLLVVKCHGKGHRDPAFDEVRRSAEHPGIIFIDEVYPVEKMRALQASCDSFVSLHRSEGFGLNIAECMGYGKPCIATGFSGNLDYMNHRNSVLVPYRMRRVQPGEYLRGGGQWWADPVHEAAVAAFQAVAAGGLAIKARGLDAHVDIARDLSLEAVGTTAKVALNYDRQEFRAGRPKGP